VGYAMGERLTRNLVSQSLLKALAVKRCRFSGYMTTPSQDNVPPSFSS
jgi:hypothetical protein